MSLRARSTAAASSAAPPGPATSETSSSSISNHHHHEEEEPETPKSGGGSLLQRPPSMSQRALSQTLTGTANLANLLPTGTLLAFQLLTPIFTNNGTCDAATRPMTVVLLAVLAVSCFIACFTDSVRAADGQVFYGLAISKGMFLFDTAGTAEAASLPVHALLSILVFGAVALRDRNVVSCLYPMPRHEVQEVLDIVPIGVGLMCSLLFMVFPTRRHGIGYPVTAGK